MTTTIVPRPIVVGLDRAVAPYEPEVSYVFRTLLRIAGYPWQFVWVDEGNPSHPLDIYYGFCCGEVHASIRIAASGLNLTEVASHEPQCLSSQQAIPFLHFGAQRGLDEFSENNGLWFANDIVLSCYWLLTGAREPSYARDRRDNLCLDGSFFLENSLASQPLVSHYATRIRRYFEQKGRLALKSPWLSGQAQAAFVFTHDVDYPQMIRWVECLRLLRGRGLGGISSIAGVLQGTNHFWKFAEWVDFEKQLGTRPAFYFMARQGSLLQYALGTPDVFYDIRTPAFRRLFGQLADEGCEVGLHPSYHAYRSLDQLQREKDSLEKVAGISVKGNRHHYWHLDPQSPADTLRLHERAGLLYDSSLAFDFYPGFRRGVCHPFRVFHPGERRELNLVELPPAWMDDHFDRRLIQNGVTDPNACARQLVAMARATGGIVVVDYHARGMNHDFYPHYGAWLMDFVRDNLDSSITYRMPGELVKDYMNFEHKLAAHSQDFTEQQKPLNVEVGANWSSQAAGATSVRLLKADENEKWDAFVAASPEGTIYHTTAWQAVTQEAFGHKPLPLWALRENGTVAGVLPLFLVKGFAGRRLVSVPLRDRGGVLALNREVASSLIGRAIEMTREMRCKYLELRSLAEIELALASEHDLRAEQHWVTTRVDLSNGVDGLWAALDAKSVRWAIKNARKKGVEVQIDDSPAAMETFQQIFARARHLAGIPTFSRELFASIGRHLIANGQAQLRIAWKGSIPIGGMITFLYRDTVIYAYGAPQKEWKDYHPSDVLVWHAIEQAAIDGFRWFDFGADSPEQDGLLWFKKKWGGVQHRMSYNYFLNGISKPPSFDSSTAGYIRLRKLWSSMPLLLSKKLGPLVTRQLS